MSKREPLDRLETARTAPPNEQRPRADHALGAQIEHRAALRPGALDHPSRPPGARVSRHAAGATLTAPSQMTTS